MFPPSPPPPSSPPPPPLASSLPPPPTPPLWLPAGSPALLAVFGFGASSGRRLSSAALQSRCETERDRKRTGSWVWTWTGGCGPGSRTGTEAVWRRCRDPVRADSGTGPGGPKAGRRWRNQEPVLRQPGLCEENLRHEDRFTSRCPT